MIEALVHASGHEVVGVANGTKAVDLALSERFDVILLDLMLPGALDGFGVCARLRSEAATRATPIFVISAMDDLDSKRRALDAGATAFYSKPFRPLELLQDIDDAAKTGHSSANT